LQSKLPRLQFTPHWVSGFSFLLALIFTTSLNAQSPGEPQGYARRNSFGILGAHSPNSSHILLGAAEKRKLWNVGISYDRSLFSRSNVNWFYEAEFSAASFVGDPLVREVLTETAPTPSTVILSGGPPVGCTPFHHSYSYKDPKGVSHSGTVDAFCHGRQWTIGQALLPLGLRWSLLPRRKLQPVFAAHVGYMYSTRPVPVAFAGSFNFVFDFGPGIELYRSRGRSLRVEYLYHHISNHNSASENPGIDNGLFQLSYIFGR
jgi:hypothetical protein